MGRARRCRSVVFSASVVALGATGACPAANAASEPTPASRVHEPAKAPQHNPKQRRRSPAAPHHGDYVYKVVIGGEVSDTNANATCSGPNLKLTNMTTFPETSDAAALWDKTPSAWKQQVTITSGPETTITVPYTTPAELTETEEHGETKRSLNLSGTALTSRLCEAAPPNAGVASVGEGLVTWRLPKPAASAAALLSQPPTNIDLNKLAMTFNIQPDGAVTVFGPYS
jgi:hypothetical protein